jgi:hypothetical protein
MRPPVILVVLGLLLAFIAWQARTGIFRRADPGEPANKYVREMQETRMTGGRMGGTGPSRHAEPRERKGRSAVIRGNYRRTTPAHGWDSRGFFPWFAGRSGQI